MGKTNFLMEKSWRETFKNLPKDQVYDLINAIYDYNFGDEVQTDDPVILALLGMMIPVFRENDEKYEKKCEQNRKNVNKRHGNANTTVNDGVQTYTDSTTVNDRNQSYTNATTVNDGIRPYTNTTNQSVSVSESVSDNSVEDIVNHLNQETNSKFRPKTDSTVKAIHGRLNDGYTVDDVKGTITHMAKKWKGTDMEKYLTPDTLFRPSKFEKYYNECRKQSRRREKLQSLLSAFLTTRMTTRLATKCTPRGT